MATLDREHARVARPRLLLTRKGKNYLKTAGLSLLTVGILAIFLSPLLYGVVTSLKSESQIALINAPLLYPALAKTYTYKGEIYTVYKVPVKSESGIVEIHQWALVTKKNAESFFVDPDHPEAGLVRWVGKWRKLEPVWTFGAHWENFILAWKRINFPRLLGNTIMYAVLSTIGAVFSATLVAYGFARFRFPKRDLLFYLVLATIILPPAVTLVPTYYVFHQIGWLGSYKPLIVPAFFSNAYNILLLRQFFLTIPHELDEAAAIDGAGPFRTLISIILPNATPALITVMLSHFFFAWNDFFAPLIYLAGRPELDPLTVGLTHFNQLYRQETTMIQAGALIMIVIPFIVFFLAQRFFIQGIVITGVEK